MRSLYIIEKFAAPNNGDEFYTRLKDIEKCCQDFNFSGKVIYCNCDDPSFSNFWKYFHDNFSKLRLKKLMATYYSDDPYLYEYDGKDINKTKIDSGRIMRNILTNVILSSVILHTLETCLWNILNYC